MALVQRNEREPRRQRDDENEDLPVMNEEWAGKEGSEGLKAEELITEDEAAMGEVVVEETVEGEEAEGEQTNDYEFAIASSEDIARAARNRYGDTLPDNFLSEEEYIIYERMYGAPSRMTPEEDASLLALDVDESQYVEKNILLREGLGGVLEEVDYTIAEEQVVDEDAELEEGEEAQDEMADLQQQVEDVRLQNQEREAETALTFGELPESGPPSRTKSEILEEIIENWPGDEYMRSHPLTLSGRYGTKPSTLQLPRATFVNPVQQMLSQTPNKHLMEGAQKTFGGVGIPDSPSTPAVGRAKGQKPIPLTAYQSKMAPIDADLFLGAVMPQVYASVVSVLVECRKRMGADWLRNLLKKEGGPLMLDAGAGGAGVIAWREILRAEWESMHEGQNIDEVKKKEVPYGKATVITASDTLRARASSLLENTTFIPRLPDKVTILEEESNVQQPRKRYDIIIAPHSLWPLTEDFEKKGRLETYWSLLNPDGGLLIIIEKGVPRGFEVVAGAREHLLKKYISSPGSETYESPRETLVADENDRITQKDKACIIAPCTNHTACPLYKTSGLSRGRKDWCYFTQRYTRPSYLMTVLSAKSRNHDDVEYSYLAVQRGVDAREPAGDGLFGKGFTQGDEATKEALEGFGPTLRRKGEDAAGRQTALAQTVGLEGAEDQLFNEENDSDHQPHPLTLPRVILNPLKRKGHILLDVCTPSGTYERWMVTRKNGKQVFRDARKAGWGDLWAMGAHSSEARRVNLGQPVPIVKVKDARDRRRGRLGGKGKVRFDGGGADVDEEDEDETVKIP